MNRENMLNALFVIVFLFINHPTMRTFTLVMYSLATVAAQIVVGVKWLIFLYGEPNVQYK